MVTPLRFDCQRQKYSKLCFNRRAMLWINASAQAL